MTQESGPTPIQGRSRSKRVVGAVVLLGIAGCGCGGWHVGSAYIPAPLFTVSPETTLLTSPLTPVGSVDYFAALNQVGLEQVPLERNAVSDLIRVFGPEVGPNDARRDYLLLIKAADLPKDGDYFEDQYAFQNRRLDEWREQGGERPKEIDAKEIERAANGGWSRDEFPDVAAWIDANERHLDVIAAALRDKKCFLPHSYSGIDRYVFDTTGPPLASDLHDVARLLAARAHLRITAGDADGAWQDVLTLHRVTRVMGGTQSSWEVTYAYHLEKKAARLVSRLALESELDAATCRAHIADLQAIGPPAPLLPAINVGSRYTYLSDFQDMALDARKRSDAIQHNSGVPTGHVDWDSALRQINHWFDQQKSALELPTFKERVARLQQAEQELGKTPGDEKAVQGRLYVAMLFNSRRSATDAFTRHWLHSCDVNVVAAEAEAIAGYRLAMVALALFAHRAENKDFPASLDALVPASFEMVPEDPFIDQPVSYVRPSEEYCLIYCVGPNLQDDGGESVDNRQKSGDDVSLWRLRSEAQPDTNE